MFSYIQQIRTGKHIHKFIKAFALLLLLAVTAVSASAASSRSISTESNAFWVAFMNNLMQVETEPSMDLRIIVTPRQTTTINVVRHTSTGPGTPMSQTVTGGTVYEFVISPEDAYIYESESLEYKGLYVYSTDGTDFSCFAYNRVGVKGTSSRDVALVLPAQVLDKEYFVQTYSQESKATEFVVVATEEGTTEVTITPSVMTNGNHSAGNTFTISMQRGQTYMVTSLPRSAQMTQNDLSGSKICSDKNVAVFVGNQAAKIPLVTEVNTDDHTYEQVLPTRMLGTKFYMALSADSRLNEFIVTTVYSGTNISVKRGNYNGTVNTTNYTNVNAGVSTQVTATAPKTALNATQYKDVVIESDKPVLCFYYLSSANNNQLSEYYDEFEDYIDQNWGDPSNAFVPSWKHRVKAMNFFVKALDPQAINEDDVEAGLADPINPHQHYYVQVVLRATDTTSVVLDGTPVHNVFSTFVYDETMAYANIPVNGTGYHEIHSTGDGFVGYVYCITEGQGYMYTLGYVPDPYADSLFIAETDSVMSKNYNLDRKDQGWYQRQLEDWPHGQEHLDTAFVCDSSTVHFTTQIGQHADSIVWSIYRYDQDGNKILPAIWDSAAVPSSDVSTATYKFILDPQKTLLPPQRDPYTLYGLEVELIHSRVVCTSLPPLTDTLFTLIQVNRKYNDSIQRVICMGDTVHYFFDHHDGTDYVVPHDRTTRLDSTAFISSIAASPYKEGYVSGYNSYKRIYQTMFGCDSIVTFELYVCDTFRTIIDTSYCENELSKLYITDKLQGSYFSRGSGVYLDTLKTRGCDYRRYDPLFEGCDSIIEVRLTLGQVPVKTLYRTWCSMDTVETFYEWIVGENWLTGKDDTIMISSLDPRFVRTGTGNNKKKVGLFADTMMTHSCPECPGGGCDSIIRLQLTIPLNISRTWTESFCDSFYNATTHTLYKNETYKWRTSGTYRLDQTKRLWNNTTGEYVRADSLTYLPPRPNNSRYMIVDSVPGELHWNEEQQMMIRDCDTAFILYLTPRATHLTEQTITIPDNVQYTWTRTANNTTHTDVLGPFSAEDSPYMFVDSIFTCSSIYECNCYDYFHLYVVIASNYYYEETLEMCDNDTLRWDTHHCRHAGDTVFRNMTPGTYIIYDSLRTTAQPMETDSVYRLTLTVYPTYSFYDTLSICDNDYVNWQGLLIAGDKADMGDQTPDRVYSHGLRRDTVHYATQFTCDSVYYLTLYVYESFYQAEDSVVCQDAPFAWTGHEGHNLTDMQGNPVTLSTAEAGTFVYLDHLYTEDRPMYERFGVGYSALQPGCDSIFRLTLTVRPSYVGERILVEEDTTCQSDLPYIWTGHLDEHGLPREFNASGTYRDSLTTAAGCDSVMELRLIVIPNVTQNLDTILCQNDDPFYFGAQRHYIVPADSMPGTWTISKNVGIAGKCSYQENLTFTIYPSFYHQQYDTVCQDRVSPAYDWVDSTDAVHSRVAISIARTGDYVYRDSFTTVHGCDSIWTLYLHVDTVYRYDETITICSNDTLTWQERTFEGHAPGTFYYDKTWLSAQLCDSSYYLTLNVLPAYPEAQDTTYFNICDNETFTFYDVTYNANGEWVSPTHAEQRKVFTRMDTTTLGCDSMVAHVVYVHPTWFFPQRDTVCRDTVNTVYTWTDLAGQSRGKSPSRAQAGTYVIYDSLHTAAGCDSVYELTLMVLPSYYSYFDRQMSNEDTIHWQGVVYGGSTTVLPHDIRVTGADTTIITHYPTVGAGSLTCDSTIELFVRQGKIYRDTLYDSTCSNVPYTWYRLDYLGNDSVVMTGLTEEKTYIDRHQTYMGYDSLFFLVLNFYPTYLESAERTTRDSICQGFAYEWVDHKTIPAGLPVGEYTFYDSLSTEAHGCDSIWTLHLRVDSVYDYTDRITICSNDTLDWQNRRIYDLPAGDYQYDVVWTSAQGCDSAYHLNLHVNPAYLEVAATDTTYHTICDNDTLLFYGTTYNAHGEWVSPTHEIQRFELSYWDTTAAGCDSLAVHVVYVHPTYLYHTPDTATCRFVPFTWEGHENRLLYLVETGRWTDSIAVSTMGTFHYVDSLKTQTCPLCHEGEGCDSVWTLTLTVHPVGRFDSSYVVCSNDLITWQRRLFVGHDYDTLRWGPVAPTAAAYDSVVWLPDTLEYADTAKYQNEFGCDVIYYLQLRIDTMAYTRLHESICDNDSTWTFGHDRWYHTSAEFYPANYQDYRPDRQVVLLDSLFSQVTGCDSIVEMTLDIYPSYRFDTTIVTCSNVLTNWRNHVNVNYWPSGTYYDTVPTAHGCDSVFVLHLNIVPSFYSRQTQYICKNDTIEWQMQRIYFRPENERDVYTTYTVNYSTGETCDSTYILDVYFFDWYTQRDTDVICGNQPYYWRGRTLTQPGVYYDSLQTQVCHCDSTFILYLSHHPVYLFEQYDSICRNEEWAVGDYVMDDTLYSIYGCDSIYRTYLHVSPDYAFDTVFTFRDDEVCVWQNNRYVGYQVGGNYRVGEYYDTVHYTSRFGCDSVYRARFTVYYEHYDTARVFCTGESTMWHGRTYTSQRATTIYDTIRTYTTWGNDSTFYFRVHFNQSYYFPDSVSVCVDEGYENWHGHPVDSLLARAWLMTEDTTVTYWDSCLTVSGCDSVYKMTIHVRPITYTEIWDTLCIGDSYPFHNRYLTEGGTYVDTGLNVFGCKHIETLYLNKIDPREYKIMVTEVCADGGGYSIAVTCGARKPKTYSIIYDENDQLDDIVGKVYDDSVILVPIPQPATRQDYVRPDWYHAKLYLEGVCVDNEIVAQQYDLLIRYPSWIIEQHWNDAIGILVPELNGGYSFDAYQWYQNNEMLVGETDSYLFQPHYLEDGGFYYVALTRAGEDYAIPTCPIQTSIGPDDPIMPTTPYISVVPTIVEKENPVVYVLSPNEGDYYIYDPHGTLYKSGTFLPDDHAAFDLRVPSVPGMYIIRLKDTTGLRRDVKILVK